MANALYYVHTACTTLCICIYIDVQIVDFLLAVLRNSDLEMNTRDVASLVISNFGEVKSKDLVKTNKIPAILSVMVS
jgi:hypothetical protein